MWGYTAGVLRYDFDTAVITKDYRNCVCSQQVAKEAVGIVLEPSSMPSSHPSVAMHFSYT